MWWVCGPQAAWYIAWAAWQWCIPPLIQCVAGGGHSSTPETNLRVSVLPITCLWFPRDVLLRAASKASFLRRTLALFSCREGGLWNLLVARERLVPICYFDFLAECVSSYQVRNCDVKISCQCWGHLCPGRGVLSALEPMLARGGKQLFCISCR